MEVPTEVFFSPDEVSAMLGRYLPPFSAYVFELLKIDKPSGNMKKRADERKLRLSLLLSDPSPCKSMLSDIWREQWRRHEKLKKDLSAASHPEHLKAKIEAIDLWQHEFPPWKNGNDPAEGRTGGGGGLEKPAELETLTETLFSQIRTAAEDFTQNGPLPLKLMQTIYVSSPPSPSVPQPPTAGTGFEREVFKRLAGIRLPEETAEHLQVYANVKVHKPGVQTDGVKSELDAVVVASGLSAGEGQKTIVAVMECKLNAQDILTDAPKLSAGLSLLRQVADDIRHFASSRSACLDTSHVSKEGLPSQEIVQQPQGHDGEKRRGTSKGAGKGGCKSDLVGQRILQDDGEGVLESDFDAIEHGGVSVSRERSKGGEDGSRGESGEGGCSRGVSAASSVSAGDTSTARKEGNSVLGQTEKMGVGRVADNCAVLYLTAGDRRPDFSSFAPLLAKVYLNTVVTEADPETPAKILKSLENGTVDLAPWVGELKVWMEEKHAFLFEFLQSCEFIAIDREAKV